MKSIPSLILTGLFGVVCAGESSPVPPYGAADFMPTAQTPIGFRADGNGWYPGANPPIEWWDGTPEMRAIKTTWNNETHNFWVPADKRSKNILWKAPLPGVSDSQPIIVGDRVLTICEPDRVLCHDVLTGKLLWQDKLAVMLLPVLGKDRKSLDPAPDPTKARIEQVAWELTRACYLLNVQFGGRSINTLVTDEQWPGHRPRYEKSLARLREWKALLGAEAPASYLAGFDDLIKSYQEVLDAPDAKARKEIWWRDGANGGPGRRNAFIGAFSSRHAADPVPVVHDWEGDINGTFSTPVSDGEIVVVCFAYGQFAAYEVATGKRLWAFRDSVLPTMMRMNHGPSPLLYRDLVLIRSGDGYAIMGLDKKTGAIRWETAFQERRGNRPGGHGNYITPLLMDLPVAEGGKRTVLVTQEPPVLDPLTGEVLGRLEVPGYKEGNRRIYQRSEHGSIVGRDGEVFGVWGYDGPSSPTYGFKLSLAGGKLVVTKGPNACFTSLEGYAPKIYRPGVVLGEHCSLFDPTNGNWCWRGKSQGPGGRMVSTLCGDLMISSHPYATQRSRLDFVAYGNFYVSDVRDPQRQRYLSDRNILDGSALPADPIWDTYLQGFDKKVNIGCYEGLAAWFGPRAAGVACRGERIFIQSALGLWCIGPAVKGLPTDDPKIVATIRASTTAAELLPHLTSDSAQYRYESVTRLATIKTGFSEELTTKLKELLIKDPYEEIRAGALSALDAAVEKSGWTVFLAELSEIEKLPEQQRGYRERDLALTLKALGEGAQSRLTQAASNNTDPIMQRGLLFLATYLDVVNPALTEIALAAVAKPSTRETDGQLVQKSAEYLSATGGRDPRAIAALSTSPQLKNVEGNQVWLEALLLRSSLSDLPKYLEMVLRASLVSNTFYAEHPTPIIPTAARRLGAAQAIPLLEKIAAEVPAVAKNLEPVLKMLKTPVLNPLPDTQAGDKN